MSESETIKNNDTDEFYIRQDIYNRVCEDRQSLLTELAYLRVERDRLRAALVAIVDIGNNGGWQLDKARNIARLAIKGAPE